MARSRRPYLIRAIYEWATENGFTPHLVVAAGYEGVVVPKDHVKDGRITLNIGPEAVHVIDLHRQPIVFSARFGGQPFEVRVPTGAVLAVFARENGEGLVFGEVEPPEPVAPPAAGGKPGRAKLRVVK